MSTSKTREPPLPPRQSDTAAALIGDATPVRRDGPPFLVTKEHRRFVEFADAVRRNRYIGVCFGPAGIGKTLSSRVYSGADDWEQWFLDRYIKDPAIPEIIDTARTAMWTPKVTTTPRELDRAIPALCQQVSWAIECHHHPDYDPLAYSDGRGCGYTELLIVDEADRLKATGLEQLRDFFDRHHLGLILIGMPGMERRLERYPQLYSRIGFAHQYRPLSDDELAFVLERHWNRLGLALNADDFTDAEAIAAVARITGGNFRLIHRLFGQIQRVLELNDLHTITREVVDAARDTLVIGT
ncbi:MAG: AAA family ATPase [Rhodococcus sp. (in: high G+C Gram-positive bacteria)]